MTARLFSFTAGDTGPWRITSIEAITGEILPTATKLDIHPGAEAQSSTEASWVLRGIVSNERYVTREERNVIVAKQLPLGRGEARCAALIAIRKNDAWWALTQDERLDIFKQKSQHTRIGLQSFPELARRLHHCRDLSDSEAFDFITWFEYPADDQERFNQLLTELRSIEEWSYVEREVDVRLIRDDAS